jgi:hypothetical protein
LLAKFGFLLLVPWIHHVGPTKPDSATRKLSSAPLPFLASQTANGRMLGQIYKFTPYQARAGEAFFYRLPKSTAARFVGAAEISAGSAL